MFSDLCLTSSWDVSNVTEMDSMFNFSKINQDISKWNLSSLKHNKNEIFMRHIV